MAISLCSFGVGAQEAETESNPFANFFGAWGLQAGEFRQITDGQAERAIVFVNHLTECTPVNTSKSVFCTITADGLAGHMLWSYDGSADQMHHLSNFGPVGQAVLAEGLGEIDALGNIRSSIRFEGKPQGYYRIYEFTWINEDSYTMSSHEYDAEGAPTGEWYGATYVRLLETD